MIYLIHVPSLDICKIGHANSPARRLLHAQAFIPGKAEIVDTRAGGYQLEQAIHEQCRSFHVHGEWFSGLQSVLPIFRKAEIEPVRAASVSGLERVHSQSVHQNLLTDIRAFLSETGMGQSYFGKVACGNSEVVSRLEDGKTITLTTAEKIRAFMSERRPATSRSTPKETA